MLNNIHAITESDMLWEWGRAEIDSPRFGHYYSNLPATITKAFRSNNPHTLNTSQFLRAIEIVTMSRAPLLAGLKRLGTNWYRAILEPLGILELKAINYPPFVAVCPSRRLTDLVEKLDKGIAPQNDDPFLFNYQGLRKSTTTTTISGTPILISETLDEQLFVLEGYSRLSVLTSIIKSGQEPKQVEVIVGACKLLKDWYLHDDSRHANLY